MPCYRDYTKAPLSPDHCLLLESYYRSYTGFIHAIFSDPSWGKDFLVKGCKQFKVLSYCLYFRCITHDQLHLSRITPGSEPGSERIFLLRLAKKGLLCLETLHTGQTSVNAYCLTKAGAALCRDRLLSLIGHQHISLSVSCITAVYERYLRSLASSSPAPHTLSAHDFHLCMIPQMQGTPFTFDFEVPVHYKGTAMSLAEILDFQRNGMLRRQTAFVADALLRCPARRESDVLKIDDTQEVYLEQDMGMQHLNVLSGKINRYVQILGACGGSHPLRSVLFSLQTRIPAARIKQKGNEQPPTPVRCRNTFATLPLLSCLLYGPDFSSQSLSVFCKDFSDALAAADMRGNRFRDMLSYLNAACEKNPQLTLGDAIALSRADQNDCEADRQQHASDMHQKLYLARKARVESALSRIAGVQGLFLKGFSVMTTHNRRHAEIIPCLLLSVCPPAIQTVQAYSAAFFGTPPTLPPTVEPYTDRFLTSSIVLRNHFYWDLDSCLCHIYIENVSDDFGGAYRVLEYLNNLRWDGPSGYLLCLVSDDGIQHVLSMYRGTAYFKSLSPARRETLPLKVRFVSYLDFSTAGGMYCLNQSGTFFRVFPGSNAHVR